MAPIVVPAIRGSKLRSSHPKRAPVVTHPIRAAPAINLNFLIMIFDFMLVF